MVRVMGARLLWGYHKYSEPSGGVTPPHGTIFYLDRDEGELQAHKSCASSIAGLEGGTRFTGILLQHKQYALKKYTYS